MRNNPALGRPYRWEVDAALKAINQETRRQEELARCARLAGNLYAPYLERTTKPVLVIKYPVAALLLASWAVVIALGYAAYQLKLWLFPHM